MDSKPVSEQPKPSAVVVSHESDRRDVFMTYAVLAVLLAAIVGGWWYQNNQVNAMRNDLTATHAKMEQMRLQLEERAVAAKNEVATTVARMSEEVEAAKRDAKQQATRVQVSTRQQTGKAMAALKARNEELANNLDQVKKDSESTISAMKEEVGGVKTDVATTRSEVATTRNDLDKTISDLRRASGDMGVMSGLIATNASELDALKKLGEREYFEFTLTKSAATQKIGGVQLALKKADVKRNRFTMDVLADDRKVEKKDKGVNEPVQFYTSQARIPYEVVVNHVSKDKVTGYLSVPKVKMVARR